MMNWLKEIFGFLYVSYYFRWKVKDSIINFTDQLKEISNLFICMPKDEEHFEIAQATLVVLKELYPQRQFIVSADVRFKEKLQQYFNPDYLFFLLESELSFFKIPPQFLVEEIQSYQPDIALDFNPKFNLQSTYLCLASHAPIRMSFSKSKGIQFFNFQVNINEHIDLEKRYEGIVKYLKDTQM